MVASNNQPFCRCETKAIGVIDGDRQTILCSKCLGRIAHTSAATLTVVELDDTTGYDYARDVEMSQVGIEP